jgi:hypothetical protein
MPATRAPIGGMAPSTNLVGGMAPSTNLVGGMAPSYGIGMCV